MEPGHVNGVYGEVSGFSVPVSAHVKEEQLQELHVYTVTAGEVASLMEICRLILFH